MKLTTRILFVKIVCSAAGAACITLVGQLAQWANTTDADGKLLTPNGINWIIITATVLGATVKDIGSMISTSFADWKANGHTPAPPVDPPKVP